MTTRAPGPAGTRLDIVHTDRSKARCLSSGCDWSVIGARSKVCSDATKHVHTTGHSLRVTVIDERTYRPQRIRSDAQRRHLTPEHGS